MQASVALFLFFLVGTHSRPDGAPYCSLFVDHGRDSSGGGQSISFNPPCYHAGEKISVTVASPSNFKGFALFATVDGNPEHGVGQISGVPGTRTKNIRACPDSSLTQSNSGQRSSVVAHWTAPLEPAGPVIFAAVVVEAKRGANYQFENEIHMCKDLPTTTTTTTKQVPSTTATSENPVTSTEKNVNLGGNNIGGNEIDVVGNLETTKKPDDNFDNYYDSSKSSSSSSESDED